MDYDGAKRTTNLPRAKYITVEVSLTTVDLAVPPRISSHYKTSWSPSVVADHMRKYSRPIMAPDESHHTLVIRLLRLGYRDGRADVAQLRDTRLGV
jgi:hypothetical protein